MRLPARDSIRLSTPIQPTHSLTGNNNVYADIVVCGYVPRWLWRTIARFRAIVVAVVVEIVFGIGIGTGTVPRC